MARREKILNLRPLTDEQVKYLSALGERAGADDFASEPTAAWWSFYFDIDPREVDWSSPYASFKPVAFVKLFTRLQEAMRAAREDHDQIFEMMRAGVWPPGQPTVVKKGVDPFRLPEWLDYWQAENAFRRGYQDAWDSHALSTLESELRRTIQRGGGKFTESKMREIARNWSADPAVAQFFTDFADAYAAGTTDGLPRSISTIMAAVRDYRDKVYVQFSPYYFPERAHGSGFLGLRGDADYDDEPDPENDAFLEPCGHLGGSLCLRIGTGRGAFKQTFRGEDQMDDALLAVTAWARKHNWWPTLWFVDDHGGVRAVDYSGAGGVDITLAGTRTRKRRKRKRAA